jgi:serine/threonine-protein phosphatase CPPED1
VKTVLAVLLWAALAAAQVPTYFIQMSDPQFGMYASDQGFAQETANFEFAIAAANRLKPAFVVVTGDLVNRPGDPAQIAEYRRIAATLDRRIALHSVPGNHDVGNEHTAESLAAYRKLFGPDYYTFRSGPIAGFVVNSMLLKAPGKVQDEAVKQDAWLRTELTKAKAGGAKHLIVFLHHPLFLKNPDEPEEYFNCPVEPRKRMLALLHEYGVRWVFAGHYHRNAEARDGDLTMVVTGPVGKPLEGGSGFRLVTVKDGTVTHRFRGFGDLPAKLE